MATNTVEEIKAEAIGRGITRLCHFTPSRNLLHLVNQELGILATARLKRDERAIFNQPDLLRLDYHEDKICTSVEYPNAYYFIKKQQQDLLFRDWVVLLIKPSYIWRDGTHFCNQNAAASGSVKEQGLDAFNRMFAVTAPGPGFTIDRKPTHLRSCPTSIQAEVLVPDQIEPSDITGIVFSSKEQLQDELVKFYYAKIKVPNVELSVNPQFFEPQGLAKLIQSGKDAPCQVWKPIK